MNSLLASCLRIRLIEKKIGEIYPSDKIQSPIHLSNGQEAISVGVCCHLENADLVFGTYRGHALYLAKGGCLKKLIAELYGKQTGCGKGKAGSMHLADKEHGVMGCSAIVSSTIPHAVGAAYAAKLKNNGQVVACFFGEGATGEGVYHESLNFAAIHNLPLLFVCENNDLAIFTQSRDVQSYDICSHAKTYGITATHVEEGWDVEVIGNVAKQEIEQLRSGGGPRFLEIKTFRYMQHVGPGQEPQPKLTRQKLRASWEEKDPLRSVEDEASKSIQLEIERELAEAIEFAELSPFPDVHELLADVY